MTGARKMLLVITLFMGLFACAQTDNRALSESALANTGDNITRQSLNDEVSALATANVQDKATSLVNSSNATGVKRNANTKNRKKSASGLDIGLKLLDKLTGKLNWAYQQRTTSN